jgi:hypothetical protein
MSYSQTSATSNDSNLFIDGTAFDCTKTRYGAPKVNASGGKAVSVFSTEINSGLKVSTPLLLTWGLSDFEGNKQYALSLQMPSNEYANAETSAFLQNMKKFEDKIKADALTNTALWFGKTHKSPEVIDALFTPMLKYPKDKQTKEPDYSKAPTLSVKTPQYDGTWKFEIYDEEENKLFPNNEIPSVDPLVCLQKGTHLASIIQCGGLWFANGKFGVTWRLLQAVVQKPKETIGGRCLLKLNASDKAKLKAQVAPVVEVVDDVSLSVVVDDSDDEEELPVQAQATVFATPTPQTVPVVVAPTSFVEQEVAQKPAAVAAPVVKKVVKKVVKDAGKV